MDGGSLDHANGDRKKSSELCQLVAQEQRGVVNKLVAQESCSVKMACETIGTPRSTYYYHSQRGHESQLEADLETVAGQYRKYGTRRITHYGARRITIGSIASAFSA